jgi:hypothetical protein
MFLARAKVQISKSLHCAALHCTAMCVCVGWGGWVCVCVAGCISWSRQAVPGVLLDVYVSCAPPPHLYCTGTPFYAALLALQHLLHTFATFPVNSCTDWKFENATNFRFGATILTQPSPLPCVALQLQRLPSLALYALYLSLKYKGIAVLRNIHACVALQLQRLPSLALYTFYLSLK